MSADTHKADRADRDEIRAAVERWLRAFALERVTLRTEQMPGVNALTHEEAELDLRDRQRELYDLLNGEEL